MNTEGEPQEYGKEKKEYTGDPFYESVVSISFVQKKMGRNSLAKLKIYF